MNDNKGITYRQLAAAIVLAYPTGKEDNLSVLWPNMTKLDAWRLFKENVDRFTTNEVDAELLASSTIVENFKDEFPEIALG